MGTVQVFRQTEVLTAQNITGPADMLAVLQLLQPFGYTGAVTLTVQNSVVTWTLTFQTPAASFPGQMDQQVAAVGAWVVYSSTTGTAIAYSAAQFAVIFHT